MHNICFDAKLLCVLLGHLFAFSKFVLWRRPATSEFLLFTYYNFHPTICRSKIVFPRYEWIKGCIYLVAIQNVNCYKILVHKATKNPCWKLHIYYLFQMSLWLNRKRETEIMKSYRQNWHFTRGKGKNTAKEAVSVANCI